MEEETLIEPLQDHFEYLGAFEIESAGKFDYPKYVQWVCTAKSGEYIIITYKGGLISFKFGETEYDATYGDMHLMIGSVTSKSLSTHEQWTERLAPLKLVGQPRLTLIEILDFMKWNYKVGYV